MLPLERSADAGGIQVPFAAAHGFSHPRIDGLARQVAVHAGDKLRDLLRLASLWHLTSLLAGCAYYEDRALAAAQPDVITQTVSYTIHGDTACAPYVRADVEQSAREWGGVSRGHIAYRVVWDLSERTLLQYSEAPLILCRARVVDRGRDICGGITGTILEISTAPICNPHATALHELGQLAGIPHVAEATAAMNVSSLTTRLTAADVRACASVGLCPSLRPKDVTTVTVTVDPDIANPSLEYPP